MPDDRGRMTEDEKRALGAELLAHFEKRQPDRIGELLGEAIERKYGERDRDEQVLRELLDMNERQD